MPTSSSFPGVGWDRTVTEARDYDNPEFEARSSAASMVKGELGKGPFRSRVRATRPRLLSSRLQSTAISVTSQQGARHSGGTRRLGAYPPPLSLRGTSPADG